MRYGSRPLARTATVWAGTRRRVRAHVDWGKQGHPTALKARTVGDDDPVRQATCVWSRSSASLVTLPSGLWPYIRRMYVDIVYTRATCYTWGGRNAVFRQRNS